MPQSTQHDICIASEEAAGLEDANFGNSASSHPYRPSGITHGILCSLLSTVAFTDPAEAQYSGAATKPSDESVATWVTTNAANGVVDINATLVPSISSFEAATQSSGDFKQPSTAPALEKPARTSHLPLEPIAPPSADAKQSNTAPTPVKPSPTSHLSLEPSASDSHQDGTWRAHLRSFWGDIRGNVFYSALGALGSAILVGAFAAWNRHSWMKRHYGKQLTGYVMDVDETRGAVAKGLTFVESTVNIVFNAHSHMPKVVNRALKQVTAEMPFVMFSRPKDHGKKPGDGVEVFDELSHATSSRNARNILDVATALPTETIYRPQLIVALTYQRFTRHKCREVALSVSRATDILEDLPKQFAREDNWNESERARLVTDVKLAVLVAAHTPEVLRSGDREVKRIVGSLSKERDWAKIDLVAQDLRELFLYDRETSFNWLRGYVKHLQDPSLYPRPEALKVGKEVVHRRSLFLTPGIDNGTQCYKLVTLPRLVNKPAA